MIARWLGALVAGVLCAGSAAAQQPVPGEDAMVLAADQTLGAAMRNGDKGVARKLLALQFTFVDETGAIHLRKDFLGGLKAVAAAPSSDAKVKTYRPHRHGDGPSQIGAQQRCVLPRHLGQAKGRVARDGHAARRACGRRRAAALPARARRRRQALRMHESVPDNSLSAALAGRAGRPQFIPGHRKGEHRARRRRVVEAHGRRTGRLRHRAAANPKSNRIATIKRQKDANTPVTVGEIESMRLWVYGDAAAMTATHIMPDASRPNYRAARVWVKRNGQWQMAISQQTDIK